MKANERIEAALSDLRPSTEPLDRNTILYQAGYAAGEADAKRQPAARFWKATACLTTVACLAMAFVRAPSETSDGTIDQAVVVARESIAERSDPPAFQWNLDGRLAIRPKAPRTPAPDEALGTAYEVEGVPTARQLMNEVVSNLLEGEAA